MAAKNTDTSDNIVPAAAFMSRQDLERFPVTPEEIRAYIENLGLSAEDTVFRASEYDLTDKNDLIGVPLFIIQWEEKPSEEYGGMYVVVHAIRTDTQEKIVFADGGTGIAAQLLGVIERRRELGLTEEAWRHALSVPKGLVRSDYDAHVSNLTGATVPAGTTYYLG